MTVVRLAELRRIDDLGQPVAACVGQLLVGEDAGHVEPLFEGGADARQFLEVVDPFDCPQRADGVGLAGPLVGAGANTVVVHPVELDLWDLQAFLNRLVRKGRNLPISADARLVETLLERLADAVDIVERLHTGHEIGLDAGQYRRRGRAALDRRHLRQLVGHLGGFLEWCRGRQLAAGLFQFTGLRGKLFLQGGELGGCLRQLLVLLLQRSRGGRAGRDAGDAYHARTRGACDGLLHLRQIRFVGGKLLLKLCQLLILEL